VQDITQLINQAVQTQVTNLTFDIDVNAIDARITAYLQQIVALDTNPYLRINSGDTQLYSWTVAPLIALKGCLTDCQVLTDQLVSSAAELRTRLGTAPCAATTGFAPWTGLPTALNRRSRFRSKDRNRLCRLDEIECLRCWGYENLQRTRPSQIRRAAGDDGKDEPGE
jgi:hypothetical protein